MNKKIKLQFVLFLLLLSSGQLIFGQDTTYYSTDGLKLMTKEKADYYQVIKENTDKANTKDVNSFYIS